MSVAKSQPSVSHGANVLRNSVAIDAFVHSLQRWSNK